MASERQIAANRRNALKSTGPKTSAGKRRTRKNAYRHGLSAVLHRKALAEIEALALEFVCDTINPFALQLARTAAHAEFNLARIKRLRLAWIHYTYEQGALELPPPDVFKREIFSWINSGGKTQQPRLPSHTMPPPGRERMAEAIRRALPQLTKLERYEARAAAHRDRAFRELVRYHRKVNVCRTKPIYAAESKEPAIDG